MNHIEIYENIMGDMELKFEIRTLVQQFYTMKLQDAHTAIELINKVINAKINDFNNH